MQKHNESTLNITFKHKPLGCTLYRGENDLNACIASIRDDNPYISQGLRVGLYIHTLNDIILDNQSYLKILDQIRTTAAPLTIGFNTHPPSKIATDTNDTLNDISTNLLVASVVDVVKKEILFTDKCESIKKCNPINRIIKYLTEYQKNPIEFSKQSVPYLSDDFNHIMMKHLADVDTITRNKEFEAIHDYIASKFQPCSLETCNVYLRNNRNREANDIITSLNTDESQLLYNSRYILETMDTLHCFLLHSFDCGFRIRSNDFANDSKNDTVENDEELHNEINDEAMTKLYTFLKAKRKRIQEIWGKERAEHTKFVTDLNEDVSNQEEKKQKSDHDETQHYSFGNAYEYNYKQWQDGSGQHDAYVKTKYSNLQDEILNNKVFTVKKTTFDVILDKAEHKINTAYAKRGFNSIEKKHIVSLLLYTDLDELSYHFSTTFRILGNDKFVDSATKNSEFANWSHILITAVTIHGNSADKSDIEILYHGINCPLIFSSFENSFVGPTSTTVQIAVATIFAKDKGMILELDWSEWYYGSGKSFNCTWLSCYANEDERLFIKENQLRIVGIRDMKTQQNHGVYVHAIRLITHVFGTQKDWTIGSKWIKSKRDEIIIKKLMKHYDKRDTYRNKFPIYVNDTFATFMKNNVYGLKLSIGKLSKYNKLKKIFIDGEIGMFKLVEICSMFDECREIIFSYGDVNNKIVLDFDDKCLNFLLSEMDVLNKNKLFLFKFEIKNVTIDSAKFKDYQAKMEKLGYAISVSQYGVATEKTWCSPEKKEGLLVEIMNRLKIPLPQDKEERYLVLLSWGLLRFGIWDWDVHYYFTFRTIIQIIKLFVDQIFRLMDFKFE